ncbi:MAG: hypothetical protein KDA79_17105 [Planctomycetaceae bacterium]|nr:hypothetical protein [Planctomycetaceae bacterium]
MVCLVASGGTARATCGDYLARSAGSHGRQSAPAAHSGMPAGDSLQHTAASGPRLTGQGNQHLPATPCSGPQCRSRSGQWPAPLPAVLTWPAPVEASLATATGLPVMALPARSLPLSADAAGLRGYPEQVQRPPECPVV